MTKEYKMNFRKEAPRKWVATYYEERRETFSDVRVMPNWAARIVKEILNDYGIKVSTRKDIGPFGGEFYNIVISFRTNADEAAFILQADNIYFSDLY